MFAIAAVGTHLKHPFSGEREKKPRDRETEIEKKPFWITTECRTHHVIIQAAKIVRRNCEVYVQTKKKIVDDLLVHQRKQRIKKIQRREE